MLPWLIAGALVIAVVGLTIDLVSHIRRVRALETRLSKVQKSVEDRLNEDPLTGLLNRAALDERMRDDERFTGVVIVIDLDNFKGLNDSLGHLTGDEILRSVGKLIAASIREEDIAFRWGGDEFVILFHDPDRKVAELRMRELAGRLDRFHVRHKGQLSIHFSFGTARTEGRSLSESLEEADRIMLESKRARAH
jgi:diguanylate cyclase (GGDEF)-like protein